MSHYWWDFGHRKSHTVEGLMKLGATVITTCRNLQKGEALQNELKAIYTSGNLIIMECDLSSQHSIKEFSNTFKAKFRRLDVLINNAGVINNKFIKSIDGIENTFAVNTLAPFLLNNLLIQELKKSNEARIINVTSDSHERIKTNFKYINSIKDFSTIDSYAQSSLARILITYYQASVLSETQITVNCLHPGAINTNIGDNNKGLAIAIFKLVRPFLKSPSEGAETSIYLASSNDITGTTSKYFIKNKEIRSSVLSYNKNLQQKCWSLCEQLTK